MLTTVVSFQGIADARTPAALWHRGVTYVLALHPKHLCTQMPPSFEALANEAAQVLGSDADEVHDADVRQQPIGGPLVDRGRIRRPVAGRAMIENISDVPTAGGRLDAPVRGSADLTGSRRTSARR